MFIVGSSSNSSVFYLCRVMNAGLVYIPFKRACAAKIGGA